MKPELMKILLIDDDPEFLYLLKDLIRNKGFEAYTAANGIKALELMTEHNIDLVITDAIMPDTPIMSFICTLKNDYPNVPLILISGLPTNPLINNSLILGADVFIPKPIDTASLFSVINKYKAA
jgi:DNA-binding response OmpR family regulator